MAKRTILSVQFAPTEKREMKELAKAHGFSTLTAYVRVKCGFAPTLPDEEPFQLEEHEATNLAKGQIRIVSGNDRIEDALRRIERHLGTLPRETFRKAGEWVGVDTRESKRERDQAPPGFEP